MSKLKDRLNKTAEKELSSEKETQINEGVKKIYKVKDEIDQITQYFDTNHLFNEINELNPGIDECDEFYNQLNSISQQLNTLASEIHNFTL